MDTFQNSYYTLNRRSLLLIGQWPYQNSANRLCRMFLICTLFFSFSVTQISLLITNASFNTVLEIVPPLTVVVAVTTKLLMLWIYRNNMKNLLEHIVDNWKLWKSKEEMDIMHEFSKEGRILTLIYATNISLASTIFLLLPFVPRIKDLIVPLNESRHLFPIFKGEYFIDEDEHFFLIYFHMCITSIIAMMILITADVLFLVLNSHICGLFTIVGSHLEHFLNGQIQSQSSYLESIICAIKRHKRALEFAELLESSYSIPLLIQVSASLICMAVSLSQVSIMLEKPSEAVRYGIFAVAQIAHIFCICYPGQRMIDYSTEIQFKAYSGLWYVAPIEVHRLVLLIMRRSLEPCCLTAGKIFVLCCESFSKIIQTSTSYFMVIVGAQ